MSTLDLYSALNSGGLAPTSTQYVDPQRSYGGGLTPLVNNGGIKVLDSVYNDAGTLGDTDWNTRGSGSGSGTDSSQDLQYLDSQKSLYDRLLESARNALTDGLNSLTNSETQSRNDATKSQERALRGYGLQREDSTRAKQDALGSVDENARTLNNSLRRRIGMASGSGSSAYQMAAPNAVAREASQQRSKVLNSYGQNERDLDTAENDTRIDFQDILQNIANMRRQKEEELRAGVASNEQGIQNSLAEIAAERARITGGNQLSAMQPYRDRFLQLQTDIDRLPSQFANQIAPRELKVTTPSLRDYLVDRQNINAGAQQASYSPYAQLLNRQRDEEEQR